MKTCDVTEEWARASKPYLTQAEREFINEVFCAHPQAASRLMVGVLAGRNPTGEQIARCSLEVAKRLKDKPVERDRGDVPKT